MVATSSWMGQKLTTQANVDRRLRHKNSRNQKQYELIFYFYTVSAFPEIFLCNCLLLLGVLIFDARK